MKSKKIREYFTRNEHQDGICLFCKKQTKRRVIFNPGHLNIALCQTCEVKVSKDERFQIVLRLARTIKQFTAIVGRDGLDAHPPKTGAMPHLPYEEYVKLAGREATFTLQSITDGMRKDHKIGAKA